MYGLTEVKQNGTVTEAYQFDANGNRIGFSSLLRGINNQSASYTQGDQLAQSGNATYTYDGNGRLASKTTTENSISKATQYQYSNSGRLLAVTTPEKAITYRHNALGQRVAKLVNGTVTEKYLWQDLTTLLAVFDESGNVKQRFEYGLGHTPVSFTQSGQRYYIQTDHLGSPRVISNSSGVVVKAIRYDSYGNVLSDSNPAFNLPFGFAGGLYDADTKLIRFGYRDYAPETGRWTARDPIGFAGGDTNLYGYVLGDPVNFIDPLGLMEWNWSNFETGYLQGVLDASQAAGNPNISGGANTCSGEYIFGKALGEGLVRGARSGPRGPTLRMTSKYVPAPKTVAGFPDLQPAKPKTAVQGGGGLRKRWNDAKGNIFEWDSRHGTLEMYNKRGQHKGEFDPVTGKQLKQADKTRKVDP